jgi:hypothetical protein
MGIFVACIQLSDLTKIPTKMKIGLVRHFKVNHPFPEKSLLSKSEVIAWFEKYDNDGNIEFKKVDLGNINWERCYSSSMVRAVHTSKYIYNGEIIEVTGLKELDILHRLSGRVKLPFLLWAIIVRLKSFSSNKDTNEFKNKIVAFVDEIMANNESNILIVSHWFVMRILRKELMKRGMTGDDFKPNDYGMLYIYENTNNSTKTK